MTRAEYLFVLCFMFQRESVRTKMRRNIFMIIEERI